MRKYALLFVFALLLWACEKDPDSPSPATPPPPAPDPDPEPAELVVEYELLDSVIAPGDFFRIRSSIPNKDIYPIISYFVHAPVWSGFTTDGFVYVFHSAAYAHGGTYEVIVQDYNKIVFPITGNNMITFNAAGSWREHNNFLGALTSNSFFVSKGDYGYACSNGELYQYDPANDTWQFWHSFTGSAESKGVGVSYGDNLYLMEGSERLGRNVLYKYSMNPVGFEVVSDSFPGKQRTDPVGFSYNGKLYFGYGYTPGTNHILRDLYAFDPSTNEWSLVDIRFPATGTYNRKIEVVVANNTINVFVLYGDINRYGARHILDLEAGQYVRADRGIYADFNSTIFARNDTIYHLNYELLTYYSPETKRWEHLPAYYGVEDRGHFLIHDRMFFIGATGNNESEVQEFRYH